MPPRPLNISKTSQKQRIEILKYAAETRKFEIERFWQRSLFFWGFIGASFVALRATIRKEAGASAVFDRMLRLAMQPRLDVAKPRQQMLARSMGTESMRCREKCSWN